MANKVYYLSKDEYNKIIFQEDERVFVLDGSEIQTSEDMWKRMAELFMFPELPEKWQADYYSYYDFMTDLNWIKEDKIVLVIDSFSMFFKTDETSRKDEVDILENEILPFWEQEVERVVVGGKKREFNVYCVD